jgi:hypothetical protein
MPLFEDTALKKSVMAPLIRTESTLEEDNCRQWKVSSGVEQGLDPL